MPSEMIDGHVKKLTQEGVGPLREPGLCRPDHEREQRRAQRIDHAVDERRAECAAGKNGGEMREREGAERAVGSS